MWSTGLLLFLVGLAYAGQNPGWQENREYVYEVYGKSLVSLDQISNNYTGIIIKAQLALRPRSDGNLGAQITEANYAPILTELDEGLDEEISESELNFQRLKLTARPFVIVMKKGAFRDLIVESTVPNWEANFIKGMIGPLQLDIGGINRIPSSINVFRAQGESNAVFKTMEETVSGVSETLYEIAPLPKYWEDLDDFVSVPKGAEYIEVLKTKNYTNSREVPSYYFGFEGFQDFGLDNNIGTFFSRNTATRAILTGSFDSFIVQESVTEDVIYIRPSMGNQQLGSLSSVVNVTLLSVQQQNQEFRPVSKPIRAGLVYRYGQPFNPYNDPRPGNEFDHNQAFASAEAPYEIQPLRSRRSLDLNSVSSSLSSSSSDSSGLSEEEGHSSPLQKEPKLSDAPEIPLLPFFVGYDGQSMNKKQDIKESSKKLAQQIGQDWLRPHELLEQNTVGKFVILANLIKLMSESEIQYVGQELYDKSKAGYQAAASIAFRDAVAQAGTGPALLNIKKWIEDEIFVEKEAAEIIGTLAEYTRQPTEAYMKKFFEILQDETLMKNKYFNESALLSYTSLVYEVYVDKDISHSKFPTHSFGSFRTLKGREFVQKEVIVHLARKLESAIQKGDTQNIHIYIRALGNVGDKRILQVFKPYFEGTKQVSQFQRVLMVLALDKLALNEIKIARAIFYRIYQNENDFEDVRVAAVYQLIRTLPSPALLQRMAINTNVDPNAYVNSAVKSVIEQAANLKESRFDKLRIAAESARPFLTSQEFGVQYSHVHLRNFILEDAESTFTDLLAVFGGPDSLLAKGFLYKFNKQSGGNDHQYLKAQAMVSSIEDLVSVLNQQTKEFQRSLQQKQQQQSSNQKWSSEHTAKLLNQQNDQREQLEGNLFFQLGGIQKMWSFDNNTIEHLSKVIQDLEEKLAGLQKFDYGKMVVREQNILSLPTAWGLPFVYTYEMPSLVGVKGELKASAQPHIASQEGFEKPKSIEAQYDVTAFVSGRVQTEFGFFTPFDSQRYSAGYDKNLHAELPELSGKLQYNVENKQVRVELESLEKRRNLKMLHLSTRPYTAKYDIYSLSPEKQIIGSDDPHQVNSLLGHESTGIAFYVQMYSDQPLDYALLYDKFQEQPFGPVLSSILDEYMQNIEINITLNSAKTTTKKFIVQLGHQQKTPLRDDLHQRNLQHNDRLAQESWERQQEFLNKVISGSNNVEAHVVDAVLQFEGQQTIKYTNTFAGARNYGNSSANLVLQAQKHLEGSNPKQFYISATHQFSKTHGLNLNQEMKLNPQVQFYVKASVNDGSSSPSQLTADVVFSKSQNRKQYLMAQPEYKECQQEMEHDSNYQLPVCAEMTAQASLLDKFAFNVQYQNLQPVLLNQTYKLYSLIRQQLVPRISEDLLDNSGHKDRLDVQGQLSADLSYANVSLNSAYGKVEIQEVPLNRWSRSVLALHPEHHLFSRLFAEAYKHTLNKPTCVVDSTYANTFDNKTYPVNIDRDWVVVLQYVPRRPSPDEYKNEQSVSQQLNELDEGYIVYTRSSQIDSSQKEIKIMFQAYETESKLVEVILKPSASSQYPAVLVNDKQIELDNQASALYEKYLHIYPLPSGVVKVVVNDAFNMRFDGYRAKIAVLDSKFKDASRGLCGTFTGEPETDFTSPENCILGNPQKFVDSWTISTSADPNKYARSHTFMANPPVEKHCYQKNVEYVRIVAPQDLGKKHSHSPQKSLMSYTKYQTKYQIEGDEICFTLKPLPVCKDGAKEHGSLSKQVEVHCVKSSAATELWRSQIDKGASPDFSAKPATKVVMMMTPRNCMP